MPCTCSARRALFWAVVAQSQPPMTMVTIPGATAPEYHLSHLQLSRLIISECPPRRWPLRVLSIYDELLACTKREFKDQLYFQHRKCNKSDRERNICCCRRSCTMPAAIISLFITWDCTRRRCIKRPAALLFFFYLRDKIYQICGLRVHCNKHRFWVKATVFVLQGCTQGDPACRLLCAAGFVMGFSGGKCRWWRRNSNRWTGEKSASGDRIGQEPAASDAFCLDKLRVGSKERLGLAV